VPNGETVNLIEEFAHKPSMSTRASVTRAEVARMGEEDVVLMATQLEQWGTKLDELIAQNLALGMDARIDERPGIDELKTKYEVARTRFDEFKTAGSARWGTFKPTIELAWNELEDAFERWAN
jgi:hypothetical protein